MTAAYLNELMGQSSAAAPSAAQSTALARRGGQNDALVADLIGELAHRELRGNRGVMNGSRNNDVGNDLSSGSSNDRRIQEQRDVLAVFARNMVERERERELDLSSYGSLPLSRDGNRNFFALDDLPERRITLSQVLDNREVVLTGFFLARNDQNDGSGSQPQMAPARTGFGRGDRLMGERGSQQGMGLARQSNASRQDARQIGGRRRADQRRGNPRRNRHRETARERDARRRGLRGGGGRRDVRPREGTACRNRSSQPIARPAAAPNVNPQGSDEIRPVPPAGTAGTHGAEDNAEVGFQSVDRQ
ncbi:hypothetical protein F4861DRAFT_129413 [Xylaria intraflava]|nr:hypothetical protein F4861DRAFT_129413 [Xylaria intraflava]